MAGRDQQEMLADAIKTLTEAARQKGTDWAEFVTLAVAGAAANVGGIEKALEGRPGSWESDHVRGMLHATVGEDPAELLRHRTEPLRVDLWPEEMLDEFGYGELYDESRRILRAEVERHVWRYRLNDSGSWVALDAEAPSYDIPPDANVAPGSVLHVPRATEDEATLNDLAEQESALDELQFEDDPQAYGSALRDTVLAKAAELFPGQTVQVVVRKGPQEDWPATGSPEATLVEAAWTETALPWNGIAPKDQAASSIANADRDDGRLPLLRLN